MLKYFKNEFPKIEIKIDSDINAITWGEYKLGKYHIKDSLAYVTIGSTVGVGVVYNGRIAHGLASTEGGHIVYYLEDIESKDHLQKTSLLEGFAKVIETIYASKEWYVIKRQLIDQA